MRSGKLTILGLWSLLLLSMQPSWSQEKTYFSDSTSFFEFLSDQGQVPGLQFRFTLPSAVKLREADTSKWQKGETGLWYSSPMDSITQLSRFKTEIDSITNLQVNLEYLIYEEPSDQAAASEFVSALLRSNDIFPAEKKAKSELDLILLAHDSPFEPGFNVGFGYFSDFKIFMITLIITLFLSLAGSMIFLMIVFKSRRNRREQLKKDFAMEISRNLTNVLFEYSLGELREISNEDLQPYFPKEKRSNALYIEVLIDHIISLNKQMKGEFKGKLKALFRSLNLPAITAQKVNSNRWDTIAGGLIQINEMDLVEFIPLVSKHLNSPNFHIRSNAAATLLNVSKEVDLSFLKNQKYPLSNWQQMTYLRIIKYLYPTRKLLMTELFESENLSVRLFGYKLVRMVGRLDLVENLNEIASKASSEEKIEILKTIDTLGVHGHTALINSAILSSDEQLSYQAILVAGNLGDRSSVTTLLALLEQNPSFDLKLKLLESLKSLDWQTYEAIVASNPDPDTVAISHHLSDPLLNHV